MDFWNKFDLADGGGGKRMLAGAVRQMQIKNKAPVLTPATLLGNNRGEKSARQL